MSQVPLYLSGVGGDFKDAEKGEARGHREEDEGVGRREARAPQPRPCRHLMWCEVHKAKLWQKLAMLVLIIQRLVPPKTSSTQANQESGMRGSGTRAKRVEYQCRYTRCRQWRSPRTNTLLALATCSQGCVIARGSTLPATKRTKPLQKAARLELNFLQCDAGTKFREHHLFTADTPGYRGTSLAHETLPPPRTLQ